MSHEWLGDDLEPAFFKARDIAKAMKPGDLARCERTRHLMYMGPDGEWPMCLGFTGKDGEDGPPLPDDECLILGQLPAKHPEAEE